MQWEGIENWKLSLHDNMFQGICFFIMFLFILGNKTNLNSVAYLFPRICPNSQLQNSLFRKAGSFEPQTTNGGSICANAQGNTHGKRAQSVLYVHI